MIRKADGVENQMVMYMVFIDVCGQYKLIPIPKNLFRQLHPDFVSFLRCDFPWFEGLYQMPPQIGAFINGVPACPCEFDVRSLSGTAKGSHQQLPIGLVRIADIIDGVFQR